MKRRMVLALAVVLTAGACLVRGASAAEEKEKTELRFVSYPDPAEFIIADVLRRVGDAYEERHPGVRVTVETGLGYLASRELVLEGKADGMMISKMLNEPRVYQVQADTGGAHATHDLKLPHFLPVVNRIIESDEKTLAEMPLGLVTDQVSEELRSFLDFLSTDAAREAVSDLDHVELVEPSDSPQEVTEIRYKRQKVTLDQPILVH